MRFRAKILLAILLPASLLVAIAVAAALLEIRRASREAVDREFERARKGLAGILNRQRAELGRLEQVEKDGQTIPGLFATPFFEELVKGGAEPGGRPRLKVRLGSDLEDLKTDPDFLALAAPDGEFWHRQSKGHACDDACRSRGEVRWALRPKEVLFAGHHGAFLARRIGFVEAGVNGGLVVGKNLSGALRELGDNLGVRLVLEGESGAVFTSFPGGETPGAPRESEVRVGGVRHVSGRSPLEGLGQVLLYRSMAREDEQQRMTLLFGLAGLAVAVLVAAGVSARVSRGISRPVEVLVGATRKVGEGDYAARVDIPGRDELATLGAAFNEMTEGLRKRRDIMEKTLSRDVADKLMEGVELGGERRRATVLFMDVRGFTPATEGVDPAEVVAMLNGMMAFLAEPIARHGGNVNKYLGDGLMAMFGAPRDLADHAFAAVRAALEMAKGMAEWNARRAGRGLPPLQVGIGINTGFVLGGNVGSKERLEYTLIGEEVNLTSRVCGKAAPGQILVTKQTLAELGVRIRVNELEPVQVKGLSYPVPVYEVLP